MKSSNRQAFLLATLIYALIAGGLYWLLAPHSHTPPALKSVPVTLAMFQPQPAPMPTSTPKPKAPPVEKVKSTQTPPKKKPIKPKVTPKPKVKPTPKPKPHPKPKPVPKPETKSSHTPKPHQKVKPTPPAVTQPVKPSSPTPKTPKTQPAPSTPTRSAPQTHTPSPRASQIKAIEQRYLYELSQTLTHYAQDNYPPRARRRHQQGQVLLSFTLQPNGQITQITLKQNSGHRLLDQAALNILTEQMQQRFKPFPKELPQTPKKIVVPIQYSLQ